MNVQAVVRAVVPVVFFAFFAAPSASFAIPQPYKVTCKAKLWRSDAGVVGVRDLPPVSEDETHVIRQVTIGDILFELRENKVIFFFKPVIRFPGGQAITTTGYFDAAGSIRLESSRPVGEGVEEKADIRCCRDCSYSDWP